MTGPVEAEATLAPPEEETLEEQAEERKRAPLWRVLCHDDPITTMDFVVDVLRGVFGLSEADAAGVMLRAHATGSALVGRWPKDEARARVERARRRARSAGFPLTFTAEPD